MSAEHAAAPRRGREWALVAALALATAALLATGRGALLARVFPVGALAVGVALLRADPVAYVAFSWWLWMLAPAVRRLADFQAGWNPVSPVSIAPLLVGALCLTTVARRLPALRRRWLAPYAVAAACIGWGAVVGLARAAPASALYAAASWLVPVGLAAYLSLTWEHYPRYRAMLVRTFTVAALALGAYGVAQFVRPAPWDAYWMLNTDMYSIGVPEPFRVRVFSTLNSPAPYATVMCVALLVAASGRGAARWAAVATGLAGLLLSLVRAAWLGLVVGVAAYVWRLPARARRRLPLALAAAATVALAAGVAWPAVAGSPLAVAVSSRVATLGSLHADRSFKVRIAYLRDYTEEIAAAPLGHGLGATGVGVALNRGRGVRNFDNGALEVLYSLGWFAGAAYLLAALALLARRPARFADDRFAAAMHAAAAATLFQALAGNVFANVSGAALWGSLGLLAAARRWHLAAEQAEAAAPGAAPDEPPAAAAAPAPDARWLPALR